MHHYFNSPAIYENGLYLNNNMCYLEGFAELKKVSACDEFVFAGQNMFLGPTIHLPRLKCCFESHHSHLTHKLYSSAQIRSQKGQ